MTRQQRAVLLRDRMAALRRLPAPPLTPRRKRPVPQSNPNKVYMPWPDIDADHTRRAPRWFMEEEKRQLEPAVRTTRQSGESPLTRIARVLTDPEQLAVICLNQHTGNPGNLIA